MPQVFVAALLGAGLYASYRWLAKASRLMAEEMQRTQDELAQRAAGRVEKNLGALEYDPATGVYRPTNRG